MDNQQPTKLLKKLSAIFASIDSLPKDGTNDFHRYKFTSESAAKRALHPLFAEHGVILKIDVLNAEQVTLQSKDKNGFIKELTKITLGYSFIDCESGEALSGQFIGYGEDSNDKGVWKAVTGCVKYILFNTFLVATGDDPDQDDGPRARPPARSSAPMPKAAANFPKETATGNPKGNMTSAQNAKIYAMLGELKVDKDKADAWVAKVVPGKERLSALDVDEAAKVIEQLEIKLAKAKSDTDWLGRARACASLEEAQLIMADMAAAGESKSKLDGVVGFLKAKGYNV